MVWREDVTPVAHSGSISSTHQREIEKDEATCLRCLCLPVHFWPVFAGKKKCGQYMFVQKCKWPKSWLFITQWTLRLRSLFFPAHFTSGHSLHATSLNAFDNQTCGQTALVTTDSRFHQGNKGRPLTRSLYWSGHALKTLFLLLFQFCLNSVCVAHWFLDIVCIGPYSAAICNWTPFSHSQRFSPAKERGSKSFIAAPFVLFSLKVPRCCTSTSVSILHQRLQPNSFVTVNLLSA